MDGAIWRVGWVRNPEAPISETVLEFLENIASHIQLCTPRAEMSAT